MGFIVSAYNTVFYEPLLNALVFLIGVLPLNDIGIAVIILTIAVKFLIFPFQHRAIITQRKMRELEPELRKIKETHKKNNQEQARKTMDLYKQHGVNPFANFVILLIQIPVFIALYKIFIVGIDFDLKHLYSFISVPDNIKTTFLGFFDMTQKGYILAALAGITQFFQMKLAMPPIKKDIIAGKSFKDDLAKSMNVQMRYILPGIIFIVATRFASAMALYWTTMNLFAIVHEMAVQRKAKKIYGKTNGNNQGVDEKNA